MESASTYTTELLLKEICDVIRRHLSAIDPELGNFRFNLRRKTRDLHQGDIIVPAGCLKLDQTYHEQILTNMKEYCAMAETLTSSVVSDKYSLLSFFLDRPRMCGRIIKEVMEKGAKYGFKNFAQATVISLHTGQESQTLPGLMDMRMSCIKYHASQLLKANGFVVHESQQEVAEIDDSMNLRLSLPYSSNCQSVSQTLKHILDKLCTSVQEKASQSSVIYKSAKVGSDFSTESENREEDCDTSQVFYSQSNAVLHMDLQQLIKNRCLRQGRGGYNVNLKSVQVLNAGQASPVLEESARILGGLPVKPLISQHHCIHIVSQCSAFTNQQVMLVLECLTDFDLTQSQIVVGPVTVQGVSSASLPSAKDFYDTRLQQFTEAAEMRNQDGSNGGCSLEDIHTLTSASIRIDVLGNAFSSSLHLDNCVSERGAESRMGAFILYNTARLATLLDKFEQCVTQGMYPPLPPIDGIDWTLLREEEDWELVYLYMSAFPEVVQQSVENVIPQNGCLLSKIHTHKVTNFLVAFCKSLSAHYSRYHILTGKEPHLLPLMFARLYMMKAAHQVLLNSLHLIGIKALSYL